MLPILRLFQKRYHSMKYSNEVKNMNLNKQLLAHTDGKANPSVSFSLSWNPNQGKLAEINEELTSLKERQEVISLKKAYDDYESTFNEYETERENLLWQYEKIMEEVSMYKELAEDTAFWYNEGIVSESEYRQANMNYAKALLSLTNSKIEQLIYNLNLKSQFVK